MLRTAILPGIINDARVTFLSSPAGEPGATNLSRQICRCLLSRFQSRRGEDPNVCCSPDAPRIRFGAGVLLATCAGCSGTHGTDTANVGGTFSNGGTSTGGALSAGATLTGDRVTGTFLTGGFDFELTLSNGVIEVEEINMLKARDGTILAPNDGEFVVVRNCGPMGALVPQFETRADGPYAFLNANTFVSSDPGSGSGGVSITFYERK